MTIRQRTYQDIREALLARQEIALLDVREEDPHAQAHPLFAANFPLARIELDAYAKLPRRTVPIALLDEGGGEAEIAARRLIALGYSDVGILAGGVAGWQAAGGELFRDVNVPSKAFGELVEARRHTPSLAAEEVQALIDQKADMVIVDARRFDEYHTMSIPGGISVPGAELALRVPRLAPDPATLVIVNCAGRTRSIIGTQSLINAGLPNPVRALRNGTIGWTLAGQRLEHGQSRRFGEPSPALRAAARALADRAGVARTTVEQLEAWRPQTDRSTYFFDVRTPEEYRQGHLPGFRSYPGGQLVQETEMPAPVRGGRIVLADDDGIRANMTASWLAQMGWEVHVVDGISPQAFREPGDWSPPLPALPAVPEVTADELHQWLTEPDRPQVIDLGASANYLKAHIPGAWFALRSGLKEALARIPPARRHVLTCGSGLLAAFAVAEVQALVDGQVFLLAGGNRAWGERDLPWASGPERLASPAIDRYRRPYEGTDNPRDAMQGYLDWEFGLVEQLARDGTHGFRVL